MPRASGPVARRGEGPRPAEAGLRSPAVHRSAVGALVIYLVVLAGVAFLPAPGTARAGQVGRALVNLTLSRPELFTSWEAQRNVLMLVPLGLLLPLIVRWRYELLVLTCLATTLAIESGQLLGSLAGWISRAFDVDDLLNNTIGGLLGLALTGTALALTRRPVRWVRPPLHRLVTGALATAVVTAAVVVSAIPTPPLVMACDSPPAGAVTRLPGGATAYAGSDGSLCLKTRDVEESVPRVDGPGPLDPYRAGGRTYRVGTALPAAEHASGDHRDGVRYHHVQGAHYLLWTAPVSS